MSDELALQAGQRRVSPGSAARLRGATLPVALSLAAARARVPGVTRGSGSALDLLLAVGVAKPLVLAFVDGTHPPTGAESQGVVAHESRERVP